MQRRMEIGMIPIINPQGKNRPVEDGNQRVWEPRLKPAFSTATPCFCVDCILIMRSVLQSLFWSLFLLTLFSIQSTVEKSDKPGQVNLVYLVTQDFIYLSFPVTTNVILSSLPFNLFCVHKSEGFFFFLKTFHGYFDLCPSYTYSYVCTSPITNPALAWKSLPLSLSSLKPTFLLLTIAVL